MDFFFLHTHYMFRPLHLKYIYIYIYIYTGYFRRSGFFLRWIRCSSYQLYILVYISFLFWRFFRRCLYVCGGYDCLLLFLIRQYLTETASAVWWSEFLATDPEARVRFPALPKKKVLGLERGPLSLVSTIEELLDRKVAAPV
jgi:hypothetical protein